MVDEICVQRATSMDSTKHEFALTNAGEHVGSNILEMTDRVE